MQLLSAEDRLCDGAAQQTGGRFGEADDRRATAHDPDPLRVSGILPGQKRERVPSPASGIWSVTVSVCGWRSGWKSTICCPTTKPFAQAATTGRLPAQYRRSETSRPRSYRCVGVGAYSSVCRVPSPRFARSGFPSGKSTRRRRGSQARGGRLQLQRDLVVLVKLGSCPRITTRRQRPVRSRRSRCWSRCSGGHRWRNAGRQATIDGTDSRELFAQAAGGRKDATSKTTVMRAHRRADRRRPRNVSRAHPAHAVGDGIGPSPPA